jgi:hypothetical protein
MERIAEHPRLLLVAFTVANSTACGGIGSRNNGRHSNGNTVYLNRDLELDYL